MTPTPLTRHMVVASLAAAFILFFLHGVPGSYAQIYKYKKDGIWHYTDAPPREVMATSEKVTAKGEPAPPPLSEGTPLLAGYPARNDIERAAAATVTVKSSLSQGSGFFITTAGHIVTNKHVVRVTQAQADKADAHIERVEKRIEYYDDRLTAERRRMGQYKARIENLKKASETEPNEERRKVYQADYRQNLDQYNEWRREYSERIQQYKSEKKKFQDQRQNYNYGRSVANLAQSFTVVLADHTEFYARLVKISATHDLALLKIDGYRTPALQPGATGRLAQSDAVYAIGSPAALNNSVTSGIFSGFERGFLQTNAHIYPGNSGGPLVAADGRVLGVNTFKKLTHKFEGLGFAIPIETVMAEFGGLLP
ncbi:MAG: trypsin-like serine protease [Desulfatitalea sp.]|nr:trypsin-like peptidase domain-containing protein [Desulfatitalea sp.]NNK02698.1 trypsin-like serine protease [Desulfatitalea sp.]